MALNFNYSNSISSVGLGNETVDVRFFRSPTDSTLGLNQARYGGSINSNLGLGHQLLSPTDSNLGLNQARDRGLINSRFGLGHQLGLTNHRVREANKTTYISPNRVEVHRVINYVPVQLQKRPTFPISEVTTVTEVVKTTRFVTSASTMERMFASSSRGSNQGIFPTSGVSIQAPPHMRNQPNQIMNFLRSEIKPSMNQETFNSLNHNSIHSNVKRERVLDPPTAYSYENPNPRPSYNQGLSFDQKAVILRNLDNLDKSNYTINQDIGPSNVNPVRVTSSQPVREPSPKRNQPSFHSTFGEVTSDEQDNDYPTGYDGRTHSLPGYPEGVYGCPKCLDTFYSSQTFAAHVQTHYKQEGEEERRRRMAAKCRRRNLRLLRSSHGLTAVPDSSKGKAKGYTARRKNDKAVKVENVDKVHQGLGLNALPGTAMKGPLRSVLIKEETM